MSGEFNHNLQGNDDLTTGRLDSRFSGPTIDPLAEEAAYDPQATAIASAYIAAFNDYVRRQLKFGEGLTYLPEIGCHRRCLGVEAQGAWRSRRILRHQRHARSGHGDEVQPHASRSC